MPDKGYKQTLEHRNKLSEIHKGKKQTKEHKKMISIGVKNSWTDVEIRKNRIDSIRKSKTKEERKIKIVKCKCGCGIELNQYDCKNRVRYYIRGHNTPKGDKNKFWNGGPKNDREWRTSSIYKKWQLAIYKKDNYTCQDCGDKCKKNHKIKLNAHHIKDWKNHPKLRFDIDNGTTLCLSCHKQFHRLNKVTKKSIC